MDPDNFQRWAVQVYAIAGIIVSANAMIAKHLDSM